MTTSRHRFLLIALFTFVAVSPVLAKVASVSLSDLAKESELIVVAKVERVSRPLIGKRYAKATVTEVWKGTRLEAVEFLASPTWTCDISDAKKGEDAVLFLEKGKGSHSYRIAHFGRGRMPQRTFEGKLCVGICADVRLPAETPIEGTDGEYEWIRFVELSTLKRLVQNSSTTKE